MFVAGEPKLLLTKGEAEWRQTVRGSGLVDLRSPRFRFVVSSWLRRGHRFDLDNLVEPVLAEVGALPAELQTVWASMEVGDETGVEITEEPPPAPPPSALTFKLDRTPRGSVRVSEPLAELTGSAPVGVDEPCGCELILGSDSRGVVFGFEGPVKPTIDALWPILGGSAHAPADWRVRDLRVARDAEMSGVRVSIWLIDIT